MVKEQGVNVKNADTLHRLVIRVYTPMTVHS